MIMQRLYLTLMTFQMNELVRLIKKLNKCKMHMVLYSMMSASSIWIRTQISNFPSTCARKGEGKGDEIENVDSSEEEIPFQHSQEGRLRAMCL